jgi:hypothetical protein
MKSPKLGEQRYRVVVELSYAKMAATAWVHKREFFSAALDFLIYNEQPSASLELPPGL